MYLSRANFGHPPQEMSATAVGEILDGYLSLLQKNGQVCGEALHAVSGGEVVAYAYVVRPDSTLRQHHSRYGIAELDRICESFGRMPVWQIIEDSVPEEFPDLRGTESLCLFTSELDGQSPVCRMGTGDRFPSYLIPMDDDERERLFFWCREYNRMDGIWLSSGDLEISAYEQLASPTSLLAKQGRDLAQKVEVALEKPVYYFLVRYYGRGSKDCERKCPGCGKEWRSPIVEEVATDFWSFPFRCEACRLVSHIADAEYDDEHAHIGEFAEP